MFRINRSLGLCRLVALLLILLQGVVTANAIEYTYKGKTLNYNITGNNTCSVGENSDISGDVEIPSSIIYNGDECTVASIGYRAFQGCSGLTSITIPNSVTSIGWNAFEGCSSLTSITLPDSITSIGRDAFKGCSVLTSITLPNSVTSIGWSAFEGCSSLTSITLPNSVTSIEMSAFQGCSSLISITIPNSVTSIEMNAFYDCSSLTSITLPNSVTSIGSFAFSGCSSLTSITLPNSVTSIGDCSFGGCKGLTSITIPNTVTSIGSNAFNNCSSLTSINLPESVTSIGNYAFYYCGSLTSLTIPNSVTSIGNSAFYGCSSLTSVTIPNTVTSIGNSAFYGCSSLTSVTIPNTITSIEDWTFGSCTGLTSVTIPNTVTSIGKNAFSWCSGIKEFTIEDGTRTLSLNDNSIANCSIEKVYIGRPLSCYDGSPFSNTTITELTLSELSTVEDIKVFKGCTALTSIKLPSSVTKIAEGAFDGYSSLTSISIPSSVTEIGNSVFSGCTALTSINIPSSVKKIGNSVFSGCTALTSISIPSSVTEIGNSVFSGCTALKELSIEDGSESLSVGYNEFRKGLFNDCPLEKVHIGRTLLYDTTYDYGYSPFYNKSTITELTLSDSVTAIGEHAFENCSGFTSLTLPKSVTLIGDRAFYGCGGLLSVAIPNTIESIGEDTFSKCNKVIKGAFPDNMSNPFVSSTIAIAYPADDSEIDENIIIYSKDKTKLYYAPLEIKGEIIIPQTVTEIGSNTFYGCSGLTSISIPSSVTKISESVFERCSGLTSISIPSSVTEIGNSVFRGCTALKELTIEDGKESLSLGYNGYREGLFNACPLEKVYIGRNLSYNTTQNYGYSPFYNKSTVTELTLSDSVTTINENAFSGCSGLTQLTIPSSVMEIGNSVFRGCTALKELTIDDCTESLSLGYDVRTLQGLFNDCPLEKVYIGRNLSYNTTQEQGYSPFYNKSTITDLILSDSFTTIREDAFNGCSSLTSLTIPESVTSIGSSAFNGCSSLTSLTIPESVTSIGSSAFNGCSSLTSLTIPESVTSIGSSAFNGCIRLSSVYVKWETPLNIPEECFSNNVYSTAVLNIPDNTGEKYLYTNWRKFKNFKYSDGYTPIFTDNIFKYLIVKDSKNPHAVLIEGDYSDIRVANIPERITDDRDPSNPVRYYITAIGPNAFNSSRINVITFNSRSILETIGMNAFRGKGIGEISLPSTVRHIEEGAFNGCSSLTTVSFNSDSKLESIGADAFRGAGISKIILPSTVRRVEDGAFYGCTSLKTIELNDGLEYIGKEAFYNVTPDETRVLGSIGTIDENAFGKDKMPWDNPCKVIVSDLLKWMDIDFKNEYSNPAATGSLWLNDELITDLVIPDGITEIKPYTFCIMPKYKEEKKNSGWPNFINYSDYYYSAQLQSISLPESTEYVRRGAFMNHGASIISIPASVKEIEAYSFSRTVVGDNSYYSFASAGFTYLDSLVFDDSFSEIVIDPEAFVRRSYDYPRSPEGVYDNNLHNNSIYLGRPVKSLPDGMKDSRSLTFGNTWSSVSPGLCRGFNMEELDLGSGITTIGQYAFSECKSLSKISFSTAIDSIAPGAFVDCTALKNLKLTTSLKTLGAGVFWGCISLTDVILPPTLEMIEANAFNGIDPNNYFSKFYMPSIIMGPNVRKIGENAFNSCVASSVYITAQIPPQASNTVFGRYDGKLYLQDPGNKSVLNAYYDSFSCWDRFDSYAMSVPRSFTSSDRKILSGRAGDTFSLTATMTPQNVSLPYIFWRSTNPRCATVDQNGLVTLQPESGSPSRSSEAPCKIIAETLYAGIPALEFEVYNSDYSAIDEIVADEENSASPEIDYTQPYEIYNFNGQRLAGDIDALNPGLYIIRQGSRVEKRAIR